MVTSAIWAEYFEKCDIQIIFVSYHHIGQLRERLQWKGTEIWWKHWLKPIKFLIWKMKRWQKSSSSRSFEIVFQIYAKFLYLRDTCFNSDSHPEFGICVTVSYSCERGMLCCQLYSHWLITLTYSISTSTPPLSRTKYSWSLSGLSKSTSAP